MKHQTPLNQMFSHLNAFMGLAQTIIHSHPAGDNLQISFNLLAKRLTRSFYRDARVVHDGSRRGQPWNTITHNLSKLFTLVANWDDTNTVDLQPCIVLA